MRKFYFKNLKLSKHIILYFLISVVLSSCSTKTKNFEYVTKSPDGKISMSFGIENGFLYYQVFSDNEMLIDKSILGFEFKNAEEIKENFQIISSETKEFKEIWHPVVGENSEILNHYNESVFVLKESVSPKRELIFSLRVYNDGIAFRYTILGNGENLEILNENTMFRFAKNDSAWWIPSNAFAYEALHKKSLLSEINEAATPITIEKENGKLLCIHEAALYNYSEMFLQNAGQNSPDFFVGLWPEPDSVCARIKTPFSTPWRCVIIANSPAELFESNLILNLNEACKIEDVSWIKPLKFVGIWWALHLGEQTWEGGEKHGATTENTKRYIDFAKKYKIGGVLAEGWNCGWDTWAKPNVIPKQNFCVPESDFDLNEVVNYAKSNNVEFISHHETGGNIPDYEKQLDSALSLCNKLGIRYLKTGYAGEIIPKDYPPYGQFMVNHFQKVVELAAKYKICLNVHESIKPTGIERTWPNLLTQEVVRGNEWNAGYNATPPCHATILPFTRLVAGPMDYTPGIFKINHNPNENKRLYSTRTYQMAMYVVFYSPMMMVSDKIENYENQKEFKFIEDVPCSWDKSKLIDAKLGEFVAVARKKDENWFTGIITNQDTRLVKIPLNFLENDKFYLAEIYCDDFDTDWEKNPDKVEIASYFVTNKDTVFAAVSKAGGHCMVLREIGAKDVLAGGIEKYNVSSVEKMKVFEKQNTYGRVVANNLAMQGKITLSQEFSKKYSASGKNALIDGLSGSYNMCENWQGFEGIEDLEIILDLGKIQKFKSIKISFLNSPKSWIFSPKSVEFLISENGKNYISKNIVEIIETSEKEAHITNIQEVETENLEMEARYVKIKIITQKTCPDWHIGKGKKAWLFCDEVLVY